MSNTKKTYYMIKKTFFLLLIVGIFLILVMHSGVQAQIVSPLFNPFWSPFPSIFSVPFFPYNSFSPTSFAPFNNTFPTGFPLYPRTTNPTASVLGSLIPLPPLPIATVAGTTVFAPTTITEVELRIWLEGPPLSLTLPVPTTIYIFPEATASGLLIRPPAIPLI